MCWVNTESFYDGQPSKLNLGVAMNVDDLGDHFRVYFAGESGFQAVKKTPEMVEAYNSLVPEKSHPVVPAEPDQYEWVTQDIEPVRPGVDQYRYIKSNGETVGGEWRLAVVGDNWDSYCVHGWTDSEGDTLELRCRRFQLPEVPKLKEPFRITGAGLYEMRSGERQQVELRDYREPMWFGEAKGWYSDSGEWYGKNSEYDIVKLIKLDEVQP